MTLLEEIGRSLAKSCDELSFRTPVTHVYNPLSYAAEPYADYVRTWGAGKREVLLVGMNPGPFGMAQTGIPFGDVAMVRDFIGVSGRVGKPPSEHPKRRVEGFACTRSEVSGSRLWGWARNRFGTPERFFERFFVVNYCPLMFLEESGRNRTPDKLPASEREPLLEACDGALVEVVHALEPKWVIGVGAFAEQRARVALAGGSLQIGTILHPSPASPAANRGWAALAENQLRTLGIPL